MPNRVFLWDIDGTVVSPSLESQFISFIRTEKLVSRVRLAGRFLSVYLTRSRMPWYRLKLAYLKGETVSDVEQWIDRWWPTVTNTILPGARSAIEQVANTDTTQLFLSGTVQSLGERLAASFGIATVLGATPETDDDRFTGALSEPHPHGAYKVTYADRWLRQRGLKWAEVVALADHESDRFLLERAAVPVAVNPNSKLEALARQRGWRVVRDADLPGVVGDLV